MNINIQKMKKIFLYAVFYFIMFQQALAAETKNNSVTDGFALIPEKEIKGCDFLTGEMKMSCIPNYIQYLIEIIVGMAGTIAVIFIMVGGFKYIFSAVSEDKEAGKETIKNAIIGLIITGMAWIIVSAIIALITI